MFLIWGFGNGVKKTKVLVRDCCGACGHIAVMNIIKTYACGTIFFIPIIKCNTKYYIQCPHCGAGRRISKQEFKQLNAQFETCGNVIDINSNIVEINSVNKDIKPVIETKPQEQEKSLNTLISEEIDKTMAKVKANQNYILTEDKINKLKVALKQNLTKKFGEEQIVNIAVDEYFKKVK